MDKTKKKVIIWISSVTLVLALLLSVLIIAHNQTIKRYTYIPNETEFAFQLVEYIMGFEIKYELTKAGQLIFPNTDQSKEAVVLNVSEDEVEYLSDYIMLDNKLYQSKDFDGYTDDMYASVKTNPENSIVILTVTFNDETITIGRYSEFNHDKSRAEADDKKADRILKDIYGFLKYVSTEGHILGNETKD